MAGALALVAERGVRDFSLAEAARRAGVSGAAPYRHFRDRNALLAAAGVAAYGDLTQRLRAARASSDDPAQQLAAMAIAYMTFAFEQRAAFEILFEAGLHKSEYPQLGRAGDDAFAELTGVARRIVGAGSPEADAFALTMWATAHGYAMLALDGTLADKGLDDTAVRTLAANAATAFAHSMPPPKKERRRRT